MLDECRDTSAHAEFGGDVDPEGCGVGLFVAVGIFEGNGRLADSSESVKHGLLDRVLVGGGVERGLEAVEDVVSTAEDVVPVEREL